MIPAISRTGRVPLLVSTKAMTHAPCVRLAVQVPPQKRTLWCWAAVGLAVASAYGTAGNRTQCGQAEKVLGRTCCPNGDGCNEDHDLPSALAPHHLSTNANPGHQQVAFVKGEIDAGHPIAVRIARRGDAGHFVLIEGYLHVRGKTFLYIGDPDPTVARTQKWAFDHFRTRYLQNGVWESSYLTTGGVVGREECNGTPSH